jgi:hypothetical protein
MRAVQNQFLKFELNFNEKRKTVTATATPTSLGTVQ